MKRVFVQTRMKKNPAVTLWEWKLNACLSGKAYEQVHVSGVFHMRAIIRETYQGYKATSKV